MMDYFNIAFVLAMISFPAVFARCVRPKGRQHSGLEVDASARNERRLWFCTVAVIGIYAALMSSGYERIAHFLWMSCFPLWFLLAMPVIRAKDPGWRGAPRADRRSAALVRRDVLPRTLVRAWLALTVVWMLAVGATAAGLTAGAPGAALWWLVLFPVAAGGELALFYWCGKRSLVEPEPQPADETPEIRAAREGLRGVKLYGWFGVAAACVIVFCAPALILVWWGPSALTPAIVAGAGGGALVGIGGGVLGAMADLRRARLNNLCIGEPVGRGE